VGEGAVLPPAPTDGVPNNLTDPGGVEPFGHFRAGMIPEAG
jgi:hypothetical protein